MSGCCEYGAETFGFRKMRGISWLPEAFQISSTLVVFPNWDCAIQSDAKGTWV